ncbi:hypothetical protein ACJBU6_11421 [Exserohilum turcicum]
MLDALPLPTDITCAAHYGYHMRHSLQTSHVPLTTDISRATHYGHLTCHSLTPLASLLLLPHMYVYKCNLSWTSADEYMLGPTAPNAQRTLAPRRASSNAKPCRDASRNARYHGHVALSERVGMQWAEGGERVYRSW